VKGGGFGVRSERGGGHKRNKKAGFNRAGMG
jgi:hypothetical protein